MAVAVKTSQGTSSPGAPANPAVVSLVGVFFLLASLVIAFKLIPDLWWSAWDALGLSGSPFIGGTLLLLVVVAAAAGLLVLGGRLLGPAPAPGVRAGIVVGFLGLLLALLLARWASMWVEHWAYASRAFSPAAGEVACVVVAGLLLLAWLYLMLRPKAQVQMVRLEQGGWFTAAAYKANQGQRVRRATILGLLVLAGAGVYTMISHHVLSRGEPDWSLNVPFTGKVAVDSFGDARGFIAELPADKKNEVRIVYAPPGSNLEVGKNVSFQAYRAAVDKALEGHDGKEVAAFRAAAGGNDVEPSAYLLALARDVLAPRMRALVGSRAFGEASSRRLEGRLAQTDPEGLPELVPAFREEATRARKVDALGWELSVPAALLVLDRYTLRDVNDRADPSKNVKVVLKGDSKFTEGQIVPKQDFEAEVAELEKLREQGRDRVLPESGSLTTAAGNTVFATVTLLPSVTFTLPLLLLAASLWLAWRVVNMPTFADFLIATEAELNKVSWTTQRRLVQDTIVVITTVVLMAVFLFAMDYTWKVLLSNRFVGVLHIPKETSQQNKSVEQKRW